MWMKAYGCMSLYLSLVIVRSRLIFPILPLLCPCFLQFLSTYFLLPSLLIRGTPQRWRIIPVWSSESFMSWEDTLARVLPAPFPLYRYLHQFPGLLSLRLCFHSCLCSPSLRSPSVLPGTLLACVWTSTRTTQTPRSRSVSRCWR